MQIQERFRNHHLVRVIRINALKPLNLARPKSSARYAVISEMQPTDETAHRNLNVLNLLVSD